MEGPPQLRSTSQEEVDEPEYLYCGDTCNEAGYVRLGVEAAYAAAISRVARIGNFNALHKAVRFASRGCVFPVSQR
jgi:hypothetical protein